MQSAQAHGLQTFKASDSWVYNFKKRYGITSRKITFITTKKKMDYTAEIMAQAEMFVQDIKNEIEVLGPQHVFNSDQSGFNLEMWNGRTLAFKGEKSVSTVVQSIGSTTHSYTIMPTMSADGDLLSPLLIVLKENNGVFGPRVKESLFSHENIEVTCTKSGKMGNVQVQEWIDKTVRPTLPEGENRILLDSFSGHKRVTLPVGVQVRTIPAGATGVCQPWDVYGFRIWKSFFRRLSNGLRMLEIGIELRHRNTILKLQSLTHFQLLSPRFKKMWKYSWYRSGYLDENPGKFEHPVKFCLDEIGSSCSLCPSKSIGFLRCAWCKNTLCVAHFFHEHHYCKE